MRGRPPPGAPPPPERTVISTVERATVVAATSGQKLLWHINTASWLRWKLIGGPADCRWRGCPHRVLLADRHAAGHSACSRLIRNISKIQSQLKNDMNRTERFRISGESRSQSAGIESGRQRPLSYQSICLDPGPAGCTECPPATQQGGCLPAHLRAEAFSSYRLDCS